MGKVARPRWNTCRACTELAHDARLSSQSNCRRTFLVNFSRCSGVRNSFQLLTSSPDVARSTGTTTKPSSRNITTLAEIVAPEAVAAMEDSRTLHVQSVQPTKQSPFRVVSVTACSVVHVQSTRLSNVFLFRTRVSVSFCVVSHYGH